MTIGRLTAADGATRGATRPRGLSGGLRTAMLVVVALAAVVGLRWAAITDGQVGGITIGLLFGLALTIVGFGGSRLAGLRVVPGAHDPRVFARDTVAGLAGGTALVALALVARLAAPAGMATPTGLGPAAVFAPWLVATTVVALAEELILRGVLFTVLERAGRPAVAVAVTSAVFALMHVPVYGWHVVPLDFGVGIFLGGLRLATGRWVAPGIAHLFADVATWWL